MKTKSIKTPKHHRQIKLHPFHSPRAYSRYRTIPSLKLSGIWLEQSGFRHGETVEVIVRDNELIIKPVNP